MSWKHVGKPVTLFLFCKKQADNSKAFQMSPPHGSHTKRVAFSQEGENAEKSSSLFVRVEKNIFSENTIIEDNFFVDLQNTKE